ncbi:MAG: hypothetical protein KDA96_07910 [Planctomycetaceae bacterium]|nr:hypothetical protein [Planctomycetaceae bacterium]
MLKTLWSDEYGVLISAELVLVGTILVLGMIVGLVELQCGVVAELSDLGDAIGNLDQGYKVSGIRSLKHGHKVKAQTNGATFYDQADLCDCNPVIICDERISRGEK